MHIPMARASQEKKSSRVGKRELAIALICVFGFFIGRAQVFGFVNPLALPFLAAFMGAQGFFLTALFVGVGLVTRLGDLFVARYIVAVLFLCGYHFCAVHIVRGERRGWIRLSWAAVAAAGSAFAAGILVSALYGISLFFFTVVLLETMLARLFLAIMSFTVEVLAKH
jgi:cation transport ATPase